MFAKAFWEANKKMRSRKMRSAEKNIAKNHAVAMTVLRAV